MKPDFSIITCTRNSIATLPDTLRSVHEQADAAYEHIFVDGDSTDGTLELLRTLPGNTHILEGVRGGIAGAMNAGIKVARGDIVAHLHSDDYYLHPQVLARVAQRMQADGCDLSWYEPLAAGDDKLYEQLQQLDWYYQDDKAEFGFVADLIDRLPGCPRVLEVGCGRGAFGSKINGKVEYLGLEYNDLAAQRARSVGLDVHRRSVAEELRNHRSQYDVVCHFQVLEHVPDASGFMRDCVALLRPGGLLAVSVPAEDSMVGLSPAHWLNMPPHHVTRWSDRSLVNLLVRLGIPKVSLWHEPVAPYHSDWYKSTLRLRALARFGLGGASLAAPPRAARWLVRQKFIASALEKIGSRGFPYLDRGATVTAYGVVQ